MCDMNEDPTGTSPSTTEALPVPPSESIIPSPCVLPSIYLMSLNDGDIDFQSILKSRWTKSDHEMYDMQMRFQHTVSWREEGGRECTYTCAMS